MGRLAEKFEIAREEAGAVIFVLVDEGTERRARYIDVNLIHHRLHGVAENLEFERVRLISVDKPVRCGWMNIVTHESFSSVCAYAPTPSTELLLFSLLMSAATSMSKFPPAITRPLAPGGMTVVAPSS